MFKEFFRSVASPAASSLHRRDQWLVLAAAFVTMLVIAVLSQWIAPEIYKMLLVASLGPSIVLIFVVPNSPFSQPYPVVVGHLVGALIGVACAHLPWDLFISGAIGITLCMLAMFALGCVHPPAGATTMLPIIVGPSTVGEFNFVLFPVLVNMILLVVLALIFHRWWLKKEYPIHATPTEDPIHKHKDASPLVRLGIHPEDLESALKELDSYLNITEKDLTRVYGLAQQKAYTRKFGEVRCKHIMSRDVISVSVNTTLEDAWALLRLHKVKVLPVLDEERRVRGIISLIDFMKHAKLKGYEELYGRLEHFVKGEGDETARCVADIMTTPVFGVNENDLIAQIVPLLSDQGRHHVPVLNDEQQMVGIVTQSDLIAALYSSSIHSESALQAQLNE